MDETEDSEAVVLTSIHGFLYEGMRYVIGCSEEQFAAKLRAGDFDRATNPLWVRPAAAATASETGDPA